MQFRVKDQNAARLAAYLYLRVLAGYTIDEALFEARQALFTKPVNDEDPDWGVPVLYLRSADGFLFPSPPVDARTAAVGAVVEPPTVLVQRRLGRVRGEDIGAAIGRILSGRLEIRDQIDVIEEGGRSVGVRLDVLGGPAPPVTPEESTRGEGDQ
jgi:hypothetical protein